MNLSLVAGAPVRTTPMGQRILDVAERLFHQHGINATGVDRIVDEVGTTKRTLYQRFGSKDALVAACLQQRAHRWQHELCDTLTECAQDAGIDAVYKHAIRWAFDEREASRGPGVPDSDGPAPRRGSPEDGGSRSHSRGCAFVNAWAEIGGGDHPAAMVVQTEKQWMRELFTQLAFGEAERGRVLHLLYEGAQVLAATQSDPEAFAAARRTSRALLSAGPDLGSDQRV